MTFQVDSMKVVEVLLTDGWHQIDPGSFYAEPYTFTRGSSTVVYDPKVAGFRFTEKHAPVSGPLSSILAMRSRI